MSDDSDRIKTAYELAMERVKDLDAPSEEKRLEWKGTPEGTRIAAAFLREGGDLGAEVESFDPELRRYVVLGALEVLCANIQLPKSEAAKSATSQVLDGVRSLLKDKAKAVGEIAERIASVSDQFLNYGAQQRQQVFEQLKQQFTAQVQEAMRRQGVQGQMPPNIETMAEFQSEWIRVRVQLDQQYEDHLERFRNEIKALA